MGGISMDNEKIVGVNDFSFNKYKESINQLLMTNDVREIRFQNDVIKPFLKVVYSNLHVVEVSAKTNSSNHDYHQYSGSYITKNGKTKVATPDLVISKNWNWLNRKFDVKYCAVVEIKSPCQGQRIYKKEHSKYVQRLKVEMNRHLSATRNERVILTDGLKWEFYNKRNGSAPIRTFELYDVLHKNKWEWKKVQKETIEDEVIYDIFGKGIEHELFKEFEELKIYLIEFLEK